MTGLFAVSLLAPVVFAVEAPANELLPPVRLEAAIKLIDTAMGHAAPALTAGVRLVKAGEVHYDRDAAEASWAVRKGWEDRLCSAGRPSKAILRKRSAPATSKTL